MSKTPKSFLGKIEPFLQRNKNKTYRLLNWSALLGTGITITHTCIGAPLMFGAISGVTGLVLGIILALCNLAVMFVINKVSLTDHSDTENSDSTSDSSKKKAPYSLGFTLAFMLFVLICSGGSSFSNVISTYTSIVLLAAQPAASSVPFLQSTSFNDVFTSLIVTSGFLYQLTQAIRFWYGLRGQKLADGKKKFMDDVFTFTFWLENISHLFGTVLTIAYICIAFPSLYGLISGIIMALGGLFVISIRNYITLTDDSISTNSAAKQTHIKSENTAAHITSTKQMFANIGRCNSCKLTIFWILACAFIPLNLAGGAIGSYIGVILIGASFSWPIIPVAMFGILLATLMTVSGFLSQATLAFKFAERYKARILAATVNATVPQFAARPAISALTHSPILASSLATTKVAQLEETISAAEAVVYAFKAFDPALQNRPQTNSDKEGQTPNQMPTPSAADFTPSLAFA